MGAIAGAVHTHAFQVSDLLRPMLKILKRRSPAAPSIHTWRNIQFGASGHPIASNGKLTIFAVIDGVIFNANALRVQYEVGRDESLAKIVVCAYEQHGLAFLEQIDGDFALAIVDEAKGEILLARDRIGKRPLYWYHDDKHFLFASEIQALLATGAVPQTPAPDGLAAYLTLGYIAQDMTPIEGVNKLLPGHYLHLYSNQRKTINSYWSYSSFFSNPLNKPPAQLAEHLNVLLKEAVEERLPRQEPAGCFVSGGLGSASIAYYMTSLCQNKPVQAFTAGFQAENDDDMRIAAQVSTDLGCSQKIEQITPQNILKDLIKVVWNLGEPIADPNVLMTWKLAQMASENSTSTVFSGMGSDELLAGHMRYAISHQQGQGPLLKRFKRGFERHLLVPLLAYIYPPASLALLRDSKTNPSQASYLNTNALFNEEMLHEASPALSGLFDPDTFLHKFHRLDEIRSEVSSFLYFDVKTRLPDAYILQYDRLTTAFGLEWQAPYLSREVVEYLARISGPDLAIHDTAECFKKILSPQLSETVINRKKVLRPHFLESWSDSLFPVFELLRGGTCVDTGLISGTWLEETLESSSKRQKSFKYLWAIMILEIWMRLFITRPIRSEPPEATVLELLSE
jgi:asparagine synthase (glutamine-hydrolysing)